MKRMSDRTIANAIKTASHRSYRNLYNAARLLQGKEHDVFGTDKVRSTSISYTRKIERDAGMTLAQIEQWAASRME